MSGIARYAVTALILSLSIPAFGFIMSGILNLLYKIIASFLGNKVTYFIFNRLTFIGVFHHELSHALLATLTGAHVKKIVFFKPEGNRLGYVEYNTRGNFITKSVQQTFTSIAPVACGAASSAALIYVLRAVTFAWWGNALLSYVLVSIIIHMTMSDQDFKVMWKGYPIVFLIILILLFVFR